MYSIKKRSRIIQLKQPTPPAPPKSQWIISKSSTIIAIMKSYSIILSNPIQGELKHIKVNEELHINTKRYDNFQT